ncbi:ribonuclease H2, subunit C [Xylariaceae sp. FL1651]|nr:ribonuclease H2, subunit C [Xylariaceae sp. FL1651]
MFMKHLSLLPSKIFKMAPPLFTVDSDSSKQNKATVNLLPCRIHHDGNVNPSNTFWNPSQAQDGTHMAYLRGRKLHGKVVKLPEGYYGSVVERTDPKPETPSSEERIEDVEVTENSEDRLEVGAMKGKATFDDLMIWGHESTSDSSADPYVRGMEEWIAFAQEIHSYSTETGPTKR